MESTFGQHIGRKLREANAETFCWQDNWGLKSAGGEEGGEGTLDSKLEETKPEESSRFFWLGNLLLPHGKARLFWFGEPRLFWFGDPAPGPTGKANLRISTRGSV